MKSEFTLSVCDIQNSTKFGRTRVRTIIKKPYPLSFEKSPSKSQGGNRARLYRLDKILARLREHKAGDEEMTINLLKSDATFRNKVL